MKHVKGVKVINEGVRKILDEKLESLKKKLEIDSDLRMEEVTSKLGDERKRREIEIKQNNEEQLKQVEN